MGGAAEAEGFDEVEIEESAWEHESFPIRKPCCDVHCCRMEVVRSTIDGVWTCRFFAFTGTHTTQC